VIKSPSAKPGSQIHLVGSSGALNWKQPGADLQFTPPASLPGKYAHAIRLDAVAD